MLDEAVLCVHCGKAVPSRTCPSCGNAIENPNAVLCVKCGSPLSSTSAVSDKMNIVAESTEIDNSSANSSEDTLAKAGFIAGIIGAVLAWVFAIFGWIVSATALTLTLVSRSKNPSNPNVKKALIVSVVALIFCFISSLIGMIIGLNAF